MEHQIENYLKRLNTTIENLSQKEILTCCETLLSAYERGSNIFICGNGGSASTASHFACDINKGVSYGEEKRFRIIPLTDNFATITAYSNDVGYEDIFVEQLKNFFQINDVIIGISGSGNSKNVLKAIEFVNDNGGVSIGWTGYKGGILKKIAHFSVNANVMDMQTSEDVHLILVHIVMKVLRKKLTGSEEYN